MDHTRQPLAALAGRSVAVIGGSRYFGRLLVTELCAAGAEVTVVNRGSAPPPQGVTHARADRDDEAALHAALGERRFDAVVDQVCYTPRQAAVAARVFAGRTARYVMTSTVEVYAELGRPHGPTLTEDAVDLAAVRIRPELPWHEPDFLDRHYGEGKRQAEAVLQAAFASADSTFTSVRTAHVLGDGDFTGRLAHYTERIAARRPILVHPDPQPASFVHAPEIARFLAWTAAAEFTGPVNAAGQGTLTARELALAIDPAAIVEVGAPASPFSFERAYAMDTTRAETLGFRFSRTADLLPDLLSGPAALPDQLPGPAALPGVLPVPAALPDLPAGRSGADARHTDLARQKA
ncbi:NAD-dependent epimerase/dehydratase family protein [Streptacidiphilus jiangxiensis]|uniref:Nucleoside-diphosphate-sugar epimerase n=1 Tax=Streptacidiphilus jiangxiensis TaxID=235985 RepID=A0A1H7PUG8_STRJI|nr:NAD-dependent epimerase/dehydratase family protein [Streptacidiphilus jiangxiensis]SEL38885.1 Nucleoside-diphosphate-sugar epimerase [Streptacidiphilus jiangxiensis]